MINRVILVGRLGRDPEVRYTASGEAVCNFSLATDESFKDRKGDRVTKTEWHKVVVWRKQAEVAQQFLRKGSLVYVEGKIQSKEYESGGQKKISYEIIADIFRMLDPKKERSQDEELVPVGAVSSQSEQIDDSDIPF
jgi:single-strand DNA-binding protein